MVKVKQLARSRFVLGLSLDLFQPAGFTRLPGHSVEEELEAEEEEELEEEENVEEECTCLQVSNKVIAMSCYLKS